MAWSKVVSISASHVYILQVSVSFCVGVAAFKRISVLLHDSRSCTVAMLDVHKRLTMGDLFLIDTFPFK